MTLTLRSAAEAAARATRTKNKARNARITILLFTRKGLRWTVYAGLLALRVRMKKRLAISHWLLHPDLAGGLPGMLPVDGCDFLAYSCAAARELHPLPSLCRGAKTRKPKDVSKNGKYWCQEF